MRRRFFYRAGRGKFCRCPMFTGRAGKHSVKRAPRGEKTGALGIAAPVCKFLKWVGAMKLRCSSTFRAGQGDVRGAAPRARPAIHAAERRRIFVQGKELRRWRTGGTSSRKRRGPAQKDKPSTRGDCRSCSDPGRNLRFLHLPPFALCLRYFYRTGRTARSRIPFIFAIAIP